MTGSEFTKLLKMHQECLSDEKIFRAILSDLFPTDVQMNNILVKLFHLGLPRELEKFEHIEDPVYLKYKKKVVKTFGIDNILADEGIRLWMFSYGGAILNREINVSAYGPYVEASEETDSTTYTKDGLKEKSFEHCTFKVTLPQITVLDGKVRVEFKIVSKVGNSVDVALHEIYLSEKPNCSYDENYTGICKPKEELQKELTVDVPIQGKNFRTSNGAVVLYFLAGDGNRYEVSYVLKRGSAVTLEYVMREKMSAEDAVCLEENMRLEKEKDGPRFPHGCETKADREYDALPVVRIPKIEEYKKALLREKYFIQKEGGRKYKVTNGNLIANKNGAYTYSFEMEAELYLTDDAPITLTVGAGESNGTVLVCEGFQIIVVVDRDFGASISQGLIGVEPWKLLEALVKKLDNVKTSSRLALKLILEGPGLATADSEDAIPKGQAAALNAAENNDITVIWGPPGTGKTYTMAQIAKDALQDGKTVLVVSHSNVSVDGVVKQMVAQLREAPMVNLLTDGKVLRYGYVRDEELSQDSYAVAYNYVLNHRPDLKKRMEKLRIEKEKLRRTGGLLSQQRDKIEKDLKKLRAEVRSDERQYVEKAQLVATTISKVTVDPLFDEAKYDIVMFDEVSMAYVPQIVCAAMYAKEKIILVGDFRQLAPIVQSEAKSVLGVDIFSYLGIASGSKVSAHPWLVMLNEQRRMHPAISAFSNKHIYSNLLSDHDSVHSERAKIVSKEPFSGKAVNLVNLYGTYAAAMKNSDNSRFNILSAIVSFATALQAEENGEDSIGIITPYSAQTRLIRAMIQDHRKKEDTDVACSTVHQFQGSERNLIVFDAVESYPASKVGWLMGKEMDSVARLINVAITRAKGKLAVIAYTKFWEMKFGGTPHIFWKLIKYLMTSGNEVSIKNKTLAPYISKLPFTDNIYNYVFLDEAIDDFKRDIGEAHEKIVISIPDGELDAETQGTLLNAIKDAKSRRIRVLSKTNDYEKLPDGWKDITWASENAVFPLIIIDDKIAWYGLPISRGRFQDGNNGFSTVVQTCYSIKGEHTLEMIKTFSDFEYREIGGQRKLLTEKNGNEDQKGDGKGATGLDGFISQMEKCPKCKSPMVLARGKSGKYYLKCSSSSCKEIAYLTPKITNLYITRQHVTCPTHHCAIHAVLGQYGIYIKCDQGHYLKPDEI